MHVYIKKFDDYKTKNIEEYFNQTFEKIGLPDKLKKLKSILIKPNLLGAYFPERAVTVHPAVIEALIRYLQRFNLKIIVGDSPGGTVLSDLVYKETGIGDVCKKYNVETVNFKKYGITEKTREGIKFFITKYFEDVDAIIDVSKYKTHSLMYYTGSVKNLYGLIPGLKKSDYHKEFQTHLEFSKVIYNLYGIVSSKILVNIQDGIWGMEGEGPSSGIPRKFGLIFISEKSSALDFIASKMLGFSLKQLPYIEKSLEIDGIQPIDIKTDSRWKNFVFENVKIKKVSTIIKILDYTPTILKNVFKSLFDYYPDFNDRCKKCMVCVKSCPVNAMKLEKGMLHPEIDRDKCIKCMCCHEFCPYDAIYVHKTLLAKLIIK